MLLVSSAYNEYTVISKEYTGPLDFDITGVDCILTKVLLILISWYYMKCMKTKCPNMDILKIYTLKVSHTVATQV